MFYADYDRSMLCYFPTDFLSYNASSPTSTATGYVRDYKAVDSDWDHRLLDNSDPSCRSMGTLEAQCSSAWREKEHQCPA